MTAMWGAHVDPVRKMRESGLGYKAIARRLGIRREKVREISKRLGLDGTRGPLTPKKTRALRAKTPCALCGTPTVPPGPGRRGRIPLYCSRRCRDRADKRRVARQILARAARRGEISRPDTCSGCGAGGRIAGHHHDYAKPLEVEWLCRRCHNTRHARTVAPALTGAPPSARPATGGARVRTMPR